MTEWELRELLCEIGRRIWMRGYVAANDGNFSCRLDDDRVLTTPTQVSKGFMQPSDLCTVNFAGEQIGGTRRATSEMLMHLHIFRRRPDVRAIIHAHPPHATAFAVVQEPVPKCVLPEVEIALGEIPILKYATPGTQALAESFDPHLKDFTVFLMANHGALTLGRDPLDAYHKMEILDQYCRILLLVHQLGRLNQITSEGMADLFEIKQRLGIPDRRLQPGGSVSCAVPSPAPNVPCGGQTKACPLTEGRAAALTEEDRRRISEAVAAALRERFQR